MKKNNDGMALQFLYHTVIGRMLLKILISPCISKLAGKFMDGRASAIFIPFFRRKHGISMKGVIVPKGGFPSFNAFFCRKRNDLKLQNGAGEVVTKGGNVWQESVTLSSPCDAFLTCIPIKGNQIFDVKHTRFSLRDLLQDGKLAKEFEGGTALVFRLTPAHYHRYAYAADGRILSWRRVPGVFHSVRPICTREVPVYAQNAREYQVIETKGFGKIVQMEIGALLIGRITNEIPKDHRAIRGKEKGRFEFGGSTIMLLLKKDAAVLRNDLLAMAGKEEELSVCIGEILTS